MTIAAKIVASGCICQYVVLRITGVVAAGPSWRDLGSSLSAVLFGGLRARVCNRALFCALCWPLEIAMDLGEASTATVL